MDRLITAAITIVFLLLLTAPFFSHMLLPEGDPGMVIDGDHSDWDGVAVYYDGYEPGVSDSVNIQRFGLETRSGELSFLSCYFKSINTDAAANGYAIQSNTGTSRVSVIGCDFEMNKLDYGIWCLDTTTEYHFQGNNFRNPWK